MPTKNIFKIFPFLLLLTSYSVTAGYKITVHDVDSAYQGTTIFADTSSSPHKIVEVDMDGNIVWEYKIPNSLYKGKHGKRNSLNDVELLNNDNILFNIQLVGAYEINRAGEILWQHMDNQMSHDVDRLDNGNTLYTQGWVSKGEKHVIEIDSNGNEVWSWDGLKHYNKKPFSKHNFQGWIHVNAVTRTDDGNTFISLRNFNRLVKVNKRGEVIREQVFGGKGGKLLKKKLGPHDPEILPNGNMLVPLTAVNKVIEIQPNVGKVWGYNDPIGKKPSVSIRDANRLPNGNTLIINYNKIIELNQEGGTVWELVIPSIPRSKKEHKKYIYKAIRVD